MPWPASESCDASQRCARRPPAATTPVPHPIIPTCIVNSMIICDVVIGASERVLGHLVRGSGPPVRRPDAR
eukprot:155340-Chlamydomonas_euryale.AAC.5